MLILSALKYLPEKAFTFLIFEEMQKKSLYFQTLQEFRCSVIAWW
jgi:hypothetical protein